MAWLIGIAACVAAFWGLGRLLFPRYGWTQAITISFDTPHGLVSGTATQTISIKISPRIFPDAGGPLTDFTGEAVAVGLGDGRYVFMLLTRQVVSVLGDSVCEVDPGVRGMQPAERFRLLASQKEPLPIPEKALPPMVMFDDMTKFQTIQHVPIHTASEILGHGYTFSGAEIVVTRTPSRHTDHLHDLLPWLPIRPHDPIVSIGRYPHGHPLCGVSSRSFISDRA
ncbi:MAG: hypothetical protein AAFN94_08595 [Pseudomonadota bacterium]